MKRKKKKDCQGAFKKYSSNKYDISLFVLAIFFFIEISNNCLKYLKHSKNVGKIRDTYKETLNAKLKRLKRGEKSAPRKSNGSNFTRILFGTSLLLFEF
jgi:hypothetical protein